MVKTNPLPISLGSDIVTVTTVPAGSRRPWNSDVRFTVAVLGRRRARHPVARQARPAATRRVRAAAGQPAPRHRTRIVARTGTSLATRELTAVDAPRVSNLHCIDAWIWPRTRYAQRIVAELPALSRAVSLVALRPAADTAAGTETVWLAGPDAASRTLALTNAPVVPRTNAGAVRLQASVGGVVSIGTLVALGRSV
jgi:hypothetical protein